VSLKAAIELIMAKLKKINKENLYGSLLLVGILLFAISMFSKNITLSILAAIIMLISMPKFFFEIEKPKTYKDLLLSVRMSFLLRNIGLPLLVIIFFMSLYKDIDNAIDIDFSVNELNKKNTYIELQKVRDDFIIVNDKSKDCSSYKINLRTGNTLHQQPFKAAMYTRGTLEKEQQDKAAWDNLCWNLKNREMNLPLSLLGENIEKLEILSALQNTIAELNKQTGEIGIYIKGYADAQNTTWKKPLLKGFEYHNINYYKANDTFKSNYEIDDANIKTHITSAIDDIKPDGSYKNDDLPYLRSQYVLDNYINNFLIGCMGEKIKTGILEGVVLNQKEPDTRNTEVYITLCTVKSKPGCAKT
jgi:hypothetical protein